jgi:hypothetical protein
VTRATSEVRHADEPTMSYSAAGRIPLAFFPTFHRI